MNLLQLIKSNQIGTFISVSLLFLLPFIGFMFLYEPVNSLYRNTLIFNELFAWAQPYSWLQVLLSYIFLVLTGAILNLITDHFQLISKRNYATLFFWLLLAVFWFKAPEFKSYMPAGVLMLLAFYKILNYTNSNTAIKNAFEIGVITAISVWLMPQAIWLMAINILGLLILRTTWFRETLVSTLGFITPYFYFWLIAFLTDNPQEFKALIDFAYNKPFSTFKAFDLGELFVLLVLLILVFKGLSSFIKTLTINKVVVRSNHNLFLLFVVIQWVGLFVLGDYEASMYLLTLFLSVYLANYFTFSKSRKFDTILFYALITAITFNVVYEVI